MDNETAVEIIKNLIPRFKLKKSDFKIYEKMSETERSYKLQLLAKMMYSLIIFEEKMNRKISKKEQEINNKLKKMMGKDRREIVKKENRELFKDVVRLKAAGKTRLEVCDIMGIDMSKLHSLESNKYNK